MRSTGKSEFRFSKSKSGFPTPYRQWRHFVAMTTPKSLKPYDKFSSISNKTMVAIFPNVCLWRRSYAQNWEVLALKNCYSIEPPSYASTAYVVASFGLVSFLLFRKNLDNLREIFGQIVYRPPWQKIARTPIPSVKTYYKSNRFPNNPPAILTKNIANIVCIKNNASKY